MIYGQTTLRGALAPSNSYFGYRHLMMSGFGAVKDCVGTTTSLAECTACCAGTPHSNKCKKACKDHTWGTTPPPDTGGCNQVCTSPCATGNPADCCHYECPQGTTPPPPQTIIQYPAGGGVVDTSTGGYMQDTSSSGTNWWLIGGLGVGAFLAGKYLFGSKQ